MKQRKIINDKFNIFLRKIQNSVIKKSTIAIVMLFFVFLFLIVFFFNNEGFYDKPIAKIIAIDETQSKNTDVFGFTENTYSQKIKAIIMNGNHKDEEIDFKNSASYSQIINPKFEINDEVFIFVNENSQGEITSITLSDLKRDKYIVMVAIVFIILILLVGKTKGILSLISLIFNIGLVFLVIELYTKGLDIIMLSIIATLIFVITTILLVGGPQKSSISAIISTLIGTTLSMSIAILVMFITKSKGVFYEEMEFIISNPEKIFLAGILIGNLGGIMDIAVSLSSAIKEMYEVNPDIEKTAIIKSAKSIGGDIMGTMSNTLLFAYISGSLPMILLLLKNGYSPFYIIYNNISLEMIRALTGSIGMVLSIPISWYIAVFFLRKKKVKTT